MVPGLCYPARKGKTYIKQQLDGNRLFLHRKGSGLLQRWGNGLFLPCYTAQRSLTASPDGARVSV